MATLYGCHNKPRSPGYWANDGLDAIDGDGRTRRVVQKQVFVDDVMSQECKFDLRAVDPGCAGCERE